jgi:hypothetical protein
LILFQFQAFDQTSFPSGSEILPNRFRPIQPSPSNAGRGTEEYSTLRTRRACPGGSGGCVKTAHKAAGENGIQPGYLIGKPGVEKKMSELPEGTRVYISDIWH